MGIEVLGAGGRVGRAVAARLDEGASPGPVPVTVLATPPPTWAELAGARPGWTLAPALAPPSAAVDVPDAGWFGGIGALLADVALQEASAPREVHIAYALPGGRRVWRALGPTTRQAVVAAVRDTPWARVDGQRTPEPLAAGRRLAWFPRPVGPAHAVAVGGLEHRSLQVVPTVRTWVAVRSLRAELVQLLGRSSGDGLVGRALDRSASAVTTGDTSQVRWAAVVEVLDADDAVVRAWANGTDPAVVTGHLLATAATAASHLRTADTAVASVRDLAPTGRLLDELADDRVLRWSVARPARSAR